MEKISNRSRAAMRFVIWILLITNFSYAQMSEEDEAALQEVRRRTGLPVESYDYITTAPPAQAWRAYRATYRIFLFKNVPEVLKKAGRAAARNSGIQKMMEDEFRDIPKDFQREQPDLQDLGGIPAPWSARILGRYLMDTTPMYPRTDSYDVSKTSNQTRAAWGLSAMNFPGAPTQGAMPLNIDAKLQAWRDWWVANEGHIEERIKEINPEWEPEEVSTQAAESTPKSPVIPSATQKPMPTATPGIVKSLAQESGSPTLIIAIILVAAVGVGGWIYTRGGGKK